MDGILMTETIKKVHEARENLHRLDYEQWLNDSAFTWEWWLLVALTIIPLVVWWMILDKRRAYEIAFYGCMINIMALILDDLGTNLSWWNYPIKLLPIIPPFLTADSILVPIFLMIVYQLFAASSWIKLLAANLCAAAFLAFVAEPIFEWIGYYETTGWKAIYSFLFYIVSSSLARFIIVKIRK